MCTDDTFVALLSQTRRLCWVIAVFSVASEHRAPFRFQFPSFALLRAAVIDVTEVRRVILPPLLPILTCGPVRLLVYNRPVNRV